MSSAAQRIYPIPDVSSLIAKQRAYFETGATLPLEWRRTQLKALDAALRAHEPQLLASLKADLGKSNEEAFIAELGTLYGEIRHALRDLKKWMKPTRASTPLTVMPARSYQYSEPLGTTLILAPWNYPLNLAVAPLIGALSAGCTAVLKPSELAPETSRVLTSLLAGAFKPEIVVPVEGGAEVSSALLAQKWDLIFFTGSTAVGKIVALAAAKHLTPTVLELGGKSPCILDETINVEVTARRLAWGKFFNAGQTCIAPDYVLVPPKLKAPLVAALERAVKEFYGENVRGSPDYGRIVNERHFKRLTGLMTSGKIAFGGQTDAEDRYFAPTVLTDVPLDSPVMQEEIFGPILPLIEIGSVNEAIRFVRDRPKPLALYTFSSDAAVNEKVLHETSSGGAVANDTVIHFAVPTIPFGGVGDSGMGGYHGKPSFDAFSHRKSVVKRPFALDVKMRYPPYAGKMGLLRRFMG